MLPLTFLNFDSICKKSTKLNEIQKQYEFHETTWWFWVNVNALKKVKDAFEYQSTISVLTVFGLQNIYEKFK